jgi:preprotein translocase SecE subunit
MSELGSDRRAARRAQRERSASNRAQPQRTTAPEERRKSNFIVESWAELKKVEWPGQNQVIQGTVVVLIACIVVGAYLYLNDVVWKHVVSRILGY